MKAVTVSTHTIPNKVMVIGFPLRSPIRVRSMGLWQTRRVAFVVLAAVVKRVNFRNFNMAKKYHFMLYLELFPNQISGIQGEDC